MFEILQVSNAKLREFRDLLQLEINHPCFILLGERKEHYTHRESRGMGEEIFSASKRLGIQGLYILFFGSTATFWYLFVHVIVHSSAGQ